MPGTVEAYAVARCISLGTVDGSISRASWDGYGPNKPKVIKVRYNPGGPWVCSKVDDSKVIEVFSTLPWGPSKAEQCKECSDSGLAPEKVFAPEE